MVFIPGLVSLHEPYNPFYLLSLSQQTLSVWMLACAFVCVCLCAHVCIAEYALIHKTEEIVK